MRKPPCYDNGLTLELIARELESRGAAVHLQQDELQATIGDRQVVMGEMEPAYEAFGASLYRAGSEYGAQAVRDMDDVAEVAAHLARKPIPCPVVPEHVQAGLAARETILAVATFRRDKDGGPDFCACHTRGLFFDIADAHTVLVENVSDLYEAGNAPFAVIEAHRIGYLDTSSLDRVCFWYRYDHSVAAYVPMDEPAGAKRMFGFAF